MDTQCYTYDFAGQLKEAWTDEGGTTPATTQLIDDSTHPGTGPKPGAVGSCANSTPAIGNITGTGGTHPSPAPYWQTFTGNTPNTATDSMGNRVTATDHSVTGDADATHSYTPSVTPGNRNTGTAATDSGTGGPALLGKVVSTGGATDTYGYDGAGNTTSRHINSSGTPTNQRLDWDAEGHLAKVTDTTTNTQISAYLYDAGGSELIRRDPTGSTLFLSETEIHLGTAGTNNGKTTAQRYYSFPNAPTIVVGSDGSQTFEAADPQGTGDVTIQETPGAVNQGRIIARRYTKPFGEARGPAPSSWIDDHGFLGKTSDTSTGLVDIGARKYDPSTGRFVSADPVFQPTAPQSIGGYAYAGNDPVSASDPTGLRAEDDNGNSAPAPKFTPPPSPCSGLMGYAKRQCENPATFGDDGRGGGRGVLSCQTVDWTAAFGADNSNQDILFFSGNKIVGQLHRDGRSSVEKAANDAAQAVGEGLLGFGGGSGGAEAPVAEGPLPVPEIIDMGAATFENDTNLWTMKAKPKGVAFENDLGMNNLPDDFKTFDDFSPDTGIAISVKTIDTAKPSYINSKGVAVSTQMKGYIDDAVRFPGYTKDGVTVTPDMISQKVVAFVFNSNHLSDAQLWQIARGVEYANEQGVQVILGSSSG